MYSHHAGEHTLGVYPLLADDSCYFLAVDFDEADWKEDTRAFVQSCSELGAPAALEISRSGMVLMLGFSSRARFPRVMSDDLALPSSAIPVPELDN